MACYPVIRQALLYNCRPSKSDRPHGEEDLRICVLFDDNSVLVAQYSGKFLMRTRFDDADIVRMYKNTGGNGRGIICQMSPEQRKFLYLTNKFLRRATLDSTTPYVRLQFSTPR